MNPCASCGNAPRMISPKTGKELTMCETCQRAYWRDNKAKNPPGSNSGGKRGKQPAKQTYRRGKAAELKGSAYPSGGVIHRPVRPTVVIVDRSSGRYLMCEVVSETEISNDAAIPFVSDFYRKLGYRVVGGIEELDTPAVRAEAGD